MIKLRVRAFVLLLPLLLTVMALSAEQREALVPHSLEPETLHYKVMFKWGLINKQAGTATIVLSHDTEYYYASLMAASAPWADKIFCVRDTLRARMTYSNFTPLLYEKSAHEGSDRKHDVVRYDYSTPGVIRAECTRKSWKKGELMIDERREMQSEGKAVDMLTSFYYMRSLPFEKWSKGQKTALDIFSGKRKELLTINYTGVETVDIDGVAVPAYHVTFTFTSKGGKKTSDDMDAWIAADKSRTPLRLEGKLPVGKVHCIFTGKSK